MSLGCDVYEFTLIKQQGVPLSPSGKESAQPVVLPTPEMTSLWLDTSSGQWDDRLNGLLPEKAPFGSGLYRYVQFGSYYVIFSSG